VVGDAHSVAHNFKKRRVGLIQRNQPVRLLDKAERQRIQQNCIYCAEDGDIGSDAQRQRKNRRNR
jgi:hypothetical protein